MPRKPSVPLFKGKTKTQVTEEAFKTLGVDASRDDVNSYARNNYGIHKPIESSMYYTIKGKVKKEQPQPQVESKPESQPEKKDFWSVLRQVKALSDQVGGAERLQELAELANAPLLDRLAAFAESYK